MTADLRTLAGEALKRRVNLTQIKSEWLQQCGPCDLGMPEYGCTHPDGDYRPVMVALVAEIEALRRAVDVGRLAAEPAAPPAVRDAAARTDPNMDTTNPTPTQTA